MKEIIMIVNGILLIVIMCFGILKEEDVRKKTEVIEFSQYLPIRIERGIREKENYFVVTEYESFFGKRRYAVYEISKEGYLKVEKNIGTSWLDFKRDMNEEEKKDLKLISNGGNYVRYTFGKDVGTAGNK
jgi:hypothetical protein